VSELAGQAAVVTGSSSGIGRAIALELAAAGADCLIHARKNRDGAEAVAAEIRRDGGKAEVVLADLADESQDSLVEQAFHWRSQIHIWINNAGADTLTGPAANWSFEQKLDTLWKIDVLATIRLSRAVGQRMRARGGTIINMSWDQVESGMEGDSGELFAASKGAIAAFSRSLAQSLAPTVRVNCLAPGWIKTAWGMQAGEAWQKRAVGESLLRRWGTPEDVARVARFLASPAAAFITGQTIAINGGRA
jgi:3-oxoacyl-[acyl-carrier protein] reductase